MLYENKLCERKINGMVNCKTMLISLFIMTSKMLRIKQINPKEQPTCQIYGSKERLPKI